MQEPWPKLEWALAVPQHRALADLPCHKGPTAFHQLQLEVGHLACCGQEGNDRHVPLEASAAASLALAAGVVAQDLFLGGPLGAALVGPAEPWEQRSLAWDHHQVSFPELVAAGNQIQLVEASWLGVLAHTKIVVQDQDHLGLPSGVETRHERQKPIKVR